MGRNTIAPQRGTIAPQGCNMHRTGRFSPHQLLRRRSGVPHRRSGVGGSELRVDGFF